MSHNICIDCGVGFYAKSKAKKRCPECESEHIKAREKFYKARRKAANAPAGKYEEKNWRKWFRHPLVLEEETPKQVVSWEKNHYCGGYDKENLACIKCYEDQVAEYKGCYGGKK